jgi:protein-ribulosamine 3-kinase
MLPPGLKAIVEEKLAALNGSEVKILSVHSVPGGSINQAARLSTARGNYFVKWNSARLYPGMFSSEKKGLEHLSGCSQLHIPKPLADGNNEETAFLILEFIESGIRVPEFWDLFGRGLAQLHKCSTDYFGLEYDNYIGSLAQSNRKHGSWSEFFIQERLEPQLKKAVDVGKSVKHLVKGFERLYLRLAEIFPPEPSALLHGDLWNGNYMTGNTGKPVIFDPAVYYGHREMDIAMTHLFGGFDREFYQAYQDEYPLEKGWESRADICNLYPLLVHVNLFGGGYVQQVEQVLRKF